MGAREIRTTAAVDEFARGLLDPRRREPWCVVSTEPETGACGFDVPRIEEELNEISQVYVIRTGDLTRHLEAQLPEKCQVYGGAARVYPVGSGWQDDPTLSPLRFIHQSSAQHAATDRLISDALTLANEAGLFAQPPRGGVRAAGTVCAFLAGGERAFVRLTSGRIATVHGEFAAPGVPLEWILADGQAVTGMLDEGSGRLHLDLTRLTPAELLLRYPGERVTLALVLDVERQKATLAVHPDVPIPVQREDVSANPRDRLDLLLAPGDVVPVRVVRDPQGRIRLRLSDIDDDEVVHPSPVLVPDGAPWLIEGRHRPIPAPDVAAEAPVPAPGTQEIPAGMPADTVGEANAEPNSEVAPELPTDPLARMARAARNVAGTTALRDTQLALAQARGRIRDLEREVLESGERRFRQEAATLRLELGQVLAERDAARTDSQRLRREMQELRELLRQAARPVSDPLGFRRRRELFDSSAEWVRHEIFLAWLERVAPAERDVRPLAAAYNVGSRFTDSLEDLDDGQLAKAFKAVVDVLTGLVREVAARRPHPLRTGMGAEDADVIRPSDGARCMRVHIEQNVAAARRLHYWQLPDGTVELSRVVTHDDIEP